MILRRPQPVQVFELPLTILPAPGAGLWLPGDLFWLPLGSWGGSGSVQGLLSLMLLLLWSLKWAASSFLLGFRASACGYRGMLWVCGQKYKIKDKLCITGCYVGKPDPGEGLKGLRSLRDGWKQGLGWCFLVCSAAPGKDSFSMPFQGSWLPWASPLHSVPQRAGFWGGNGAQHLPKGATHSFNFVAFIPL